MDEHYRASYSSSRKNMIDDEGGLEFARHACLELAGSFTNPKDHNLHAALNGLIRAVETNRARILALEAELERIRGGATPT